MKDKALGTRQIRQEDIPEFQKIMRMLNDYAEKFGSFGSLPAEQKINFYSRRILEVAPPEEVVFAITCVDKMNKRKKEGPNYLITGSLMSKDNPVTTTWIHQDALYFERSQYGKNSGHPTLRLVCVTDLYNNATETGGR